MPCAEYPTGTPASLHRSRNQFFNAHLRDELLDGEIFYTLRKAQIIIESWHYNIARPHAWIGYRAPVPEVFVPALAAWPAAQSPPASPAFTPLVPRPTLD